MGISSALTTARTALFPWKTAPIDEPTEPILGELFGTDRLAQHARQLARRQRTAPPEISRRQWWGDRKSVV